MNRIRELRLEKELTQVELGKKIYKSDRMVGFYETGERDPDTDTLKLLSKVLDVSVDYILGLSNVRKPTMTKEQFEKELLDSDFAKAYVPLTEEQKKTLKSLAEVWVKEIEEKKKK